MKTRVFATITLLVFLTAASPVSLLAAEGKRYEVEMVVQSGDKSRETDALLIFNDENFQVVPKKDSFKKDTKDLTYSSLKQADYSYSKKPMLSGGGAIATALLVGVLVVPFLFMKKKNHWMTIQTENEFAVLKLGSRNFRAIIAEFETHGVKVNEVKEEKEKK